MGTLIPGCWCVRIPFPRLGVTTFWPGPTSVVVSEAGCGAVVVGCAVVGEKLFFKIDAGWAAENGLGVKVFCVTGAACSEGAGVAGSIVGWGKLLFKIDDGGAAEEGLGEKVF